MTNEEFQELVLEELKNIKASIVTKDDLADAIAKLPTREEFHQGIAEQQKDIMAMLTISTKLDKHSEILHLLSSRSIEQEAEILVLKRAR
jgi:hypothetical protein